MLGPTIKTSVITVRACYYIYLNNLILSLTMLCRNSVLVLCSPVNLHLSKTSRILLTFNNDLLLLLLLLLLLQT
jgi:hypothetical protein